MLGILSKSTVGLVLVVVAPFLITVFYAPALFGFAFGEEWRQAGIYSQWLVMPWLLNFICGPCVTFVPIYGYQRSLLIFECLTLAPRLAIIPLVSYVSGDVATIAIYSVAGTIFHLCILVFVFLHTWRHQISLVRKAPAEA